MTPEPTPYRIGEKLIEVENVSLRLGQKQILRDINFDIFDIIRPGRKQGQVLGLLGPSGIGKTQLFKVLSGLTVPTTGSVKIGSPLKPVKPGLVGVVQQHYPLFRHLTVYENLELGARTGNRPALKETILETLEDFRLLDHASKYPIQLSGGQRQRVAIAQQFLCSDHYMLLDEPVSGLDTIMVDKVCELLTLISTKHEHNTIVVITHDIAAAVRLSDTVFLLGRDSNTPGATIKHKIDLIARGLAWQPHITSLPAYSVVQQEIRELFQSL